MKDCIFCKIIKGKVHSTKLYEDEKVLCVARQSRIKPGDITLNVSKNYVPKCFINDKPCKWGNIVEKYDVTWIASYKNPVTGDNVYVDLDRKSSQFVCANDLEKFEKARKLAKNIDKIRTFYSRPLTTS